MNTENNRRFQNTESLILEAYGKIVKTTVPEKVTVADLCREAGIHRTTFYSHFQDIPELTAYVEQLSIHRLIREFFTEQGLWDLRVGFRRQLEFYREHRTVILRHLNSENGGRLFRFYNPLAVKEYRQAYIKAFRCENENELAYHAEYFNAGITAVIKKWMVSGCKEPPERVAEYIIKFARLPDAGSG